VRPSSNRARRWLASLARSGTARRRALVLLPALALATAFAAGLALAAVSGGWPGLLPSVGVLLLVLVLAVLLGRWAANAVRSLRVERRAFWLEEKLAPLELTVTEEEPVRVNVIHPAIDLRHFFGGFIAVFNLARRLRERGHRVRLLVLDPPDLPSDWRRRLCSFEGIGASAETLEVVFAHDRRAIPAHPDDALVATHWTAAHVAAGAAVGLRAKRFLYLIQEYEPFIFPMGSAAALARASYDLPHTALFSTELLRQWFADERIGVYAGSLEDGDRHSASFANAITPVGPVGEENLARPGPRRLLFYARPEEHAARNLFEIGAMGLDAALAEGRFAGWDLIGVGSVAAGEMALRMPRSGRSLRLHPRTTQDRYAALLRSGDVGLALMHTPHPSLVPIEMAGAGMPAVTTEFANKDAAALARISPNLIAAKPTAEGVAAALAEAERRVADLERRAAGSHVDWPSSWDVALADPLLERVEQLLRAAA
jgi:hypothetical protein